MDFRLNAEFVELDNVLKAVQCAASGADAKQIIRSGAVKVNGAVETRVRRKLRAGDVIEFEQQRIDIIGPADGQ